MFRPVLIIFTELLNISKAYIYKNKNGLLHTTKFVRNMSAGIIKLAFSNGKLVRKVRRLHCYRILQWFISGGCQVYVLVANTTLQLSMGV